MSAPQRPPQLRDSKSELYEAAREVMKAREQAAQLPKVKPPASRVTWLIVLLLVGLVGALLLLLRPVWLAGPTALPPESPGIAAASLRLELLRERQRVFVYERAHGRLPASLTETGSLRHDLQYLPSGPSQFSLSGRAGDSLITLRSTDSLPTFLGESLRRFKTRGAE